MPSHMKSKLPALLLAAAMPFLTVQHAAAMSLDQALEYAYDNNPELKAQRAALKQTNERYNQALSGWRPSASANFEFGRESITRNNTTADQDVRIQQYQVSQPVFNGGETIASMNEARAFVKAARAALVNLEQSILLSAATAYMDVVRTREVHRLAQKNESVLSKHTDATDSRFEVGEVTRTDVSQAGSRLARATSERVQAEGDVYAAEATFKRIVRMDAPAEATMNYLPPVMPRSLEEALAFAQENNPNIRQSNMNVRASKHSVNAQKAALLPDVSLVASSRFDKGSGLLGGTGLDTESLSVNVTVPLYQSGSVYSAVRERKHAVVQQKHIRDNVLNQVAEAVASAWSQWLANKAASKANKTAIEATEIALDGVEQEYQYGTRTTLDVLDAEQEFFEAGVNYVTSQRNEAVSLFNLVVLTGQFTAQDLGLNVEIFDDKAHFNDTKYKILGF